MTTAGELYGRPWSEREYIVVLHFYFLHRDEPHHSGCDHIKEVGHLLGRTPGAISMRMENYASIDPELENKRAGLAHINELGRRVFRQWHTKPDALKDCAEAFVRDSRTQHPPSLFDPLPVRIPRAFDRYELVDLLGDGATGTVFSCIDINTQEEYAIKIIKADRIYDEEAVHRFRREIRTLKAISHPNVIKLHEDNLDSERHFPAFVMDLAACSLTGFVEAADRARARRDRPILESQQAESVVVAVCEAAAILHANTPRVIHRDINPNNILLRNETWMLADFGLAKFLSTVPISTSFRTTARQAWGTMWYAAPEQYQSFASADERADIYSLGMLIWELFTRLSPPPDRHHSGLSEALAMVFGKATDRLPEKRYRHVYELRDEFLEAVREDQAF